MYGNNGFVSRYSQLILTQLGEEYTYTQSRQNELADESELVDLHEGYIRTLTNKKRPRKPKPYNNELLFSELNSWFASASSGVSICLNSHLSLIAGVNNFRILFQAWTAALFREP